MGGSFCISIDLELAWGVWDRPDSEARTHAEQERTIVASLLRLFGENDIAATWAIVGRLLELDEVKASRLGASARSWYAPDIIEQIQNAPVRQDIGSHSYSHLYFQNTSREVIRADLAAARRVHDEHGLAFVSFVFPRNLVDHVDLLREAGIKVFRSTDQGWHMSVRDQFGKTAGRVANLVDKVLPVRPASVAPVIHRDIVELPSSMLLMGRDGLRRAIHPSAAIAKAIHGLEGARDTGRCFHLWFHPSNFYFQYQRQMEILSTIVKRATAMRARGELEIRPMSAYALS